MFLLKKFYRTLFVLLLYGACVGSLFTSPSQSMNEDYQEERLTKPFPYTGKTVQPHSRDAKWAKNERTLTTRLSNCIGYLEGLPADHKSWGVQMIGKNGFLLTAEEYYRFLFVVLKQVGYTHRNQIIPDLGPIPVKRDGLSDKIDEEIVLKTPELFTLSLLSFEKMNKRRVIIMHPIDNVIHLPQKQPLCYGISHHCYDRYRWKDAAYVRKHLTLHSASIFKQLDELLDAAYSKDFFNVYRKFLYLTSDQKICFDNLVFFPNQILQEDISKKQFKHNMKMYGDFYSQNSLCIKEMPFIIEFLCSTYDLPEELQILLLNQSLTLYDGELAPFLKKPKVLDAQAYAEICCCIKDLKNTLQDRLLDHYLALSAKPESDEFRQFLDLYYRYDEESSEDTDDSGSSAETVEE